MSRSRFALHALAGVLAAVVAATTTPAAAQSLWMPRDTDYTISLEMLRPNLEDVDSGVLSGSFFLAGRARLSPGVSFVGELPYVTHSSRSVATDFNGNEIVEDFSSSTIGNPYVGLETRIGSGPVFVEVGGRPPLTSDEEFEAVLTGIFSDVNHFATFLPHVASIQAAFNLREVTPSKLAYRFRLSPMIAIPTEGGNGSELYAMYSFQIGYHGSAARVGAGMSGQALLTEDYGNLGERSRNQFEIHADFLPGAIRPGLDLRVPLGSEANFVPVVLGASISWTR